MKRVLSFGGGLQTTAMAILVAERKLQIDEVIFADTGGEKPETYWYIESYIKPLFADIDIPFHWISGADPTHKIKRNLIEHCFHYKAIPSVTRRWCTVQSKIRPVNIFKGDALSLIGFSADELGRAQRRIRNDSSYPLIEMGLASGDCSRLISDYGWPVPLKSSCFFCPYQRWSEWNWLKVHHPELIDDALCMEQRFYERRPDRRQDIGLFGGKPLWKWNEGIQIEMPILKEYSCWNGYCGH